MFKILNWTIGIMFYLPCLVSAVHNHQLLDSHADSLNERLWSKNSPISIEIILNNLDFLENTIDEDSLQKDFEKYSLWQAPDLEESDACLKDFLSNCKKIYDDYREIYIPIPLAVSMLFERTLEKYMSHKALLEEMYGSRVLLPEDHVPSEESSKTYGSVGWNVEKVGSSCGIINDLKA